MEQLSVCGGGLKRGSRTCHKPAGSKWEGLTLFCRVESRGEVHRARNMVGLKRRLTPDTGGSSQAK